jgi:hypothetical protein
MGKQRLLQESSSTPLVKAGKRWKVVVATPGQGSSGKYSADMLAEYGPAAIPAGSKAFFDHDPKRSVKDMVGTYPEGAYWNAEENRLEADLQPFKHWQEIVDEIGPYAEASIYVMGEADEEGNVTRLIPHRSNGVDLVGYGGLEGSGLLERIETLAESARALDEPEASVTSADALKKKETLTMEIEELAAKVDSLATLVESFITESKDAAVADQAQKVTVEEALTAYRTVAKSIEDADLFPSQRDALLAEAAKGVDVTERIAEAAKIKEEAVTVLTESAPTGRVLTGSTVAPASSVIPKGW